MKELHHRVKNNLAMVSSLINLKDAESKEDLSDIKLQIEAISLVHEKLHKGNSIEYIEAEEYFKELLESVFSFAVNREIRIDANIADVSMRTKTAIPLGLNFPWEKNRWQTGSEKIL